MVLRLFYAVVLLTLISANNSIEEYATSPSECGFIFLTVSSLVTKNWMRDPKIDDKLELNWDFTSCAGTPQSDIPNKVALYSVNPETPSAKPLEIVNVADHKWNYYVTKVSLGPIQVSAEWTRKGALRNNVTREARGAQCYPFWIASFRDSRLLKTNCLKFHPTWMGDTKNQIANIPLSRLLIPGTHDAGAFAYGSYRTMLSQFVLCQDRSIWTQLVSGIRYLDFRIAYYSILKDLIKPKKDLADPLWLNHNMIRVTPLLPLLKDIRRFLDYTTDEIVILDVHQLPVGFYSSNDAIIIERHNTLLQVFQREFGNHILGFEQARSFLNRDINGPTVAQILKTGRRLIIGYPERAVTNTNKWLWPNVKHMWGNTNDPNQLKRYLDAVMDNPYRPPGPTYNPLWSAMAQTTPSSADVVLLLGSLRKNADMINRNLTYWVHHNWWNKANIVSSDFYMGNNLVEVMVHMNTKKGKILEEVGKVLFGAS